MQVADLGQGRQIVRVKNCSGYTDPQVGREREDQEMEEVKYMEWEEVK